MGLRNQGGFIAPSYNPLAANPQPESGVNSVAQTEGVFTRQSAMQAVGADEWCVDPYFNQTVLLLQADGAANNAQNLTFSDSSANNAVVTKVGNATPSSVSPFCQPNGYWSNEFSVSSISSPSSSNLVLGAGDFTIEGWVYNSGSLDGRGIFQTSTVTGVNSSYQLAIAWNNATFFLQTGAWNQSTTGVTVVANRWYHLALVKSGSTINLYVDGINRLSRADTFTYTNTYVTVGGYFSLAALYAMVGYISNFRVVVGSAVYTADFFPPTTPLTAIANTQLLTCQSNYFADNSSNSFSLSTAGTVLVHPYPPFDPARTYSKSESAGSLYINASGDYVSIPSSPTLTPGAVFTFEAWVYVPAIVSNMSIYGSTTLGELQVAFSGSTLWGIAPRGSAFVLTSSTLPKINQWNHVVVARGGTGTNETSLFLNGVRVANGTVSNAFSTTSGYQVGTNGAGANPWILGNIASVRLVTGVDVYGYTNTTITVPTEPLTAISGTQLLLKFDSSGIYDATCNNSIRLVADAKVSTDIVKYGTGSIIFDGTGDIVHVYNRPNLRVRTGDFTIEGWVYLTTLGVARSFISFGTGTTGWTVGVSVNNFLSAAVSSSGLTGTTKLQLNTWHHFAFVRAGTATNNIKLYLDGVFQVLLAGPTNTDFNDTTSLLYVGADRVAGSPFRGNLDDIRITKGVARYTENFTPPKIGFRRQ